MSASNESEKWLRKKHKFIAHSISLREDLWERIDQIAENDLMSSRSAAVSILVAEALRWRESRGQENRKP